MFPTQGGYQSPQWQQGFNPGFQRHGPPPAKKPRSTAIVTRYAPPPGYRGPGQPPPAFQQPVWQPPNPQYGYGQQVQPGYPPQVPGYGPPQQSYNPQFPGYHQNPPYQQPPPNAYPPYGQYQPAAQPYPQPPPQAWQAPISAPHNAPPQSWPQNNAFHSRPRHNSAPSPTTVPYPNGPLDGNGDPLEPDDGQHELETEYYGAECYFARHPEDIEPDLSLGHIQWNAPLPTKRPLPGTFAEAEVEALAPRKPHPSDDESISDYFINSKRYEAFLSIRQSDAWELVKNDLVFREFPAVPTEILPIPEVLFRYRDRPDPNWLVDEASPTPEPQPEPQSAPVELSSDANGGVMETDGEDVQDMRDPRDDESEQGDVLGNLEQALQQNGSAPVARHSRANSATSVSTQALKRPKIIRPVRNQAQEDLLAALGVTGSPKAVYQTPGPAVGAPPPHAPPKRQNSFGDNQIVPQGSRHSSFGSNPGTWQGSRHNSFGSNAGSWPPPPPPGPPPLSAQRHQHSISHDPWQMEEQSQTNGYHANRRGSSSSQHTATGSDFHPEDGESTSRSTSRDSHGHKRRRQGPENGVEEVIGKRESVDMDVTPRATNGRTDGRKRGYEGSQDGVSDDDIKRDGDETPRPRRKQQRVNEYPHVDDAYRRRW